MPAPVPPTFYADSQHPKRLEGRQRLLVGGLAAFFAAIAVITVLALGSTHTVGRGCIDVNTPGPFGASPVKACGVDARAICTQLRASPLMTLDDLGLIASACHTARLPVKILKTGRLQAFR
jgi:hypothetical protein